MLCLARVRAVAHLPNMVHFSKMKRDVGMADHEKGKKQGVAYPIPTSLSHKIATSDSLRMNQVGLVVFSNGMNQVG